MKKRIGLLLILVSVAVLAGCGKKDNKVEEQKDTAVAQVNKETEFSEAEGGLLSAEDVDFFEETVAEETVAEEAATEETVMEESHSQGVEPEEEEITSSMERPQGAEITTPDKQEPVKQENEEQKPEKQEPEAPAAPEDITSEPEKNPETTEKEEVSGEADTSMTYDEFRKLSPADQQKHMETFEDIESFFEWYNLAKETYEKENPPILLDGTEIDAEDLLGGE